METVNLLGTALGLSLVSGINLYATVFAIGLGIHLGLIHLAPQYIGLSVLANPAVTTIAGLLYGVHFLADKIPGLDSLSDLVHTFVRPLGAALIGAAALGTVDPSLSLVGFLGCGAIGLASHSTKTSVRLLANHSPEPLSNVALSLVDDAVTVGGLYLSLAHPAVMLAVVTFAILIMLIVLPRIIALLLRSAKGIRDIIARFLRKLRIPSRSNQASE